MPRSTPAHGGQRPTCQVCDKVGHDALRCYHRFDHTYEADENHIPASTASSCTVDSNWYADTGATDHITHDLERLTTRERYTGGDHVQVANRTGLSIAHVGNSSITGYNCLLYLNHILHVPKINRHLLSVRKLAADNIAFVEFYPNTFFVKDQVTKNIFSKAGVRMVSMYSTITGPVKPYFQPRSLKINGIDD
ncbi:RNA-directed DNA polymerase protein [Dioscorea alata]|uniref:RNA-directed DNA polymerase protein n=1 Tax=Dioscorea alata TaxID=55571 RepID=A0ACB7V942_DIOAL|nr:RNA-directed DNA polymerase protein [Dioscorea alata]